MARVVVDNIPWQSGGLHHPPLSHAGVPVALGGPFGRRRSRPSTEDCEERFFTQTLDHFRYVPGRDENTFQQRYFVCSEYWGPVNEETDEREHRRDQDFPGTEARAGRGGEHARAGVKGPIFFYTGNEADVALYIGATGLMWENAPAFKALLVFAEHRFYGESLPFGAPDKGREFLSTSQALADYAVLISFLREDLDAEGSPVVAFGGSYGGMLASWLRLKYPHIVHGAIAGSAPVVALQGLRTPTPDPEAFAAIVTRAAGPAGGAAEECSGNVRRAFSALLSGTDARTGDKGSREDTYSIFSEKLDAASEAATSEVARMLRVCPGEEPRGEGALIELAWWARAAFDYLSMGNYPYPTGYILNSGKGGVELPAWPMRTACSYLADPELKAADDDVLLGALAGAIGVYYNATGDLDCFSPAAGANNESAVDADNWNWQACTEMTMPMSTDGARDMFWLAEWDPTEQAAQCREQFGVSPRQGWAATEYGGYGSWSQATNIVFSNGRLDPWSGMGVVDQQQAGPGVRVILMDQAAHHLDLFFEHPLDPQEVREARQEELSLVEDWVRQAYEADASRLNHARSDTRDPHGATAKAAAADYGDGNVQKSGRSRQRWVDRLPPLGADW